MPEQSTSSSNAIQRLIKAGMILVGLFGLAAPFTWLSSANRAAREAGLVPRADGIAPIPDGMLDIHHVLARRSSIVWPPVDPFVVNIGTSGNQFSPAVASTADGTVTTTVFQTDTAVGLTPGADAVVSTLRDAFGNAISASDQIISSATATQADAAVVFAPANTLIPVDTNNQLAAAEFVAALAQYQTTPGTYTSNGRLVSPTSQLGEAFTLDPTSSSTNSIYECDLSVINSLLTSCCADFRNPSGYAEISCTNANGKTFISSAAAAEQTVPQVTFDPNQELGLVGWLNGNQFVGRNIAIAGGQISFGTQFTLPPFTSGNVQTNPAVAIGPNGVLVAAAQEGTDFASTTNSTVYLLQNGAITKTISLAGISKVSVAVLSDNTIVTAGINSQQILQVQMYNSTLSPLPGIAGQPVTFNLDTNGNLIPAFDTSVYPVVYPALSGTAPGLFGVTFTGNTTGTDLAGSELDIVSGITSSRQYPLVQQNSANQYVFHLQPPLYEDNAGVASNVTIAFNPPAAGVCGTQGSITLSGNATYINEVMATLPCTLQTSDGPVTLAIQACDNVNGCSTLTLNLIAAPTATPTSSEAPSSSPTPAATTTPPPPAATASSSNSNLSALSAIGSPIFAYFLIVLNNYLLQNRKLREAASDKQTGVFANVLIGDLRGFEYKSRGEEGEIITRRKIGLNPDFLNLPAKFLWVPGTETRSFGRFAADYGTDFNRFILDIITIAKNNSFSLPNAPADQGIFAQYLVEAIEDKFKEDFPERDIHTIKLDDITYVNRPAGDDSLHTRLTAAVHQAITNYNNRTPLRRYNFVPSDEGSRASMISTASASASPSGTRLTRQATFHSSDTGPEVIRMKNVKATFVLDEYGEDGLAPPPPPPNFILRMGRAVCPGSN